MTTPIDDEPIYKSSINVDGMIYFIEEHLKCSSLNRKTFNWILSLINCFEDNTTRLNFINRLNNVKIRDEE